MEQNEQQFMKLLAQADPELYIVKQALKSTGVNPRILVRIIRQLGNMAVGTGFGEIEIIMREYTVVGIKGKESDKLKEPVLDTN